MKSRRRRDADRMHADAELVSCELFVELDQHCHNHKGFRQTMDSK